MSRLRTMIALPLGDNLKESTMRVPKLVSARSVSVETFKGRVLLSGFVKSDDERIAAEGIARSVKGVKEIENKIEVR